MKLFDILGDSIKLQLCEAFYLSQANFLTDQLCSHTPCEIYNSVKYKFTKYKFFEFYTLSFSLIQGMTTVVLWRKIKILRLIYLNVFRLILAEILKIWI